MGYELEPCQYCGRYGCLESHHVFMGSGRRKQSEKHGMKLDLCHSCHLEAHMKPNHGIDKNLKEEFQKLFEQDHTREEFIRIFTRNYL